MSRQTREGARIHRWLFPASAGSYDGRWRGEATSEERRPFRADRIRAADDEFGLGLPGYEVVARAGRVPSAMHGWTIEARDLQGNVLDRRVATLTIF